MAETILYFVTVFLIGSAFEVYRCAKAYAQADYLVKTRLGADGFVTTTLNISPALTMIQGVAVSCGVSAAFAWIFYLVLWIAGAR